MSRFLWFTVYIAVGMTYPNTELYQSLIRIYTQNCNCNCNWGTCIAPPC